jgi:hypothetical protein
MSNKKDPVVKTAEVANNATTNELIGYFDQFEFKNEYKTAKVLVDSIEHTPEQDVMLASNDDGTFDVVDNEDEATDVIRKYRVKFAFAERPDDVKIANINERGLKNQMGSYYETPAKATFRKFEYASDSANGKFKAGDTGWQLFEVVMKPTNELMSDDRAKRLMLLAAETGAKLSIM